MTIEYVSGWRDLDAVARKIREVLTRQLAVVPRWQEVPEAEREAALQHAANNLAQVWPSLGEVSGDDLCACCADAVQCSEGHSVTCRRAPTAEHAAVRR